MNRYAEIERNRIERRWGYGIKFIIRIEKILAAMLKQTFDCKFAEFRPLSGQVAMLAAICGLSRPGDLIFSVSSKDGGAWYCPNNMVRYRLGYYEFDGVEWNIDLDSSARRIRRQRPKVMILGSSFFLFPHPVRELRSIADDIGARIVYDGAHVMGLIAGKQWPNPLHEGADALLGSTHKTLPGPQKGVVLTNKRHVYEKIAEALYPSIIDNHHHHECAGLAIALAEMRAFGEAYARQVVKNAKELGAALARQGFDVIGEHKGFTRSHQILIKTGKLAPAKAAKLLEQAGIFSNRMELAQASGLRFGVSEGTRMGMLEADMTDVADLVGRVLLRRQTPSKVRRDISDFMKGFNKIHYSFDRGASGFVQLQRKRVAYS
jgi:glycine hydroxymethyltransferase